MPSYEAIRDHEYSTAEWQRVLYNRNRMVIGTPDVVKQKFIALANEFDVDEIVIATFADRADDRLHSYELLADIFDLTPQKNLYQLYKN